MSDPTSRVIVPIAACLLFACAAEVGPAEDEPTVDAAAASAELTRIERINFEDYASGPLGQPWSLITASTGSTTSASVVRAGHHGNVLLMKADPNTTDFLTAKFGFSSAARELSARVDLAPGANAAFVWSLNGSGSSIAKRRIRLQRAPGSTRLVASTSPGGNTRCGRLPSDTWTRIVLRVHATRKPHTFDVLINGETTACTGIETGLGAPWRGVAIMDASNAGWGGEVRLDNIAIATP